MTHHSRFFLVESNNVPYDVQTASSYKPKGLMHIKFSNFRIKRVDKIYRQEKGNLKCWALNYHADHKKFYRVTHLYTQMLLFV